MVKLGFKLQTKGPLNQVFAYFSKFQRISQWDPNVQSSQLLTQTPTITGSTYKVTSVYKEKPSQLIYHMLDYQQGKSILLRASNGIIEATDYIQFRANQKGTEILYEADICLRHVLWLFTPFVRSGFRELAQNAEKGMRGKCVQMWGECP